jgi:hypothetical protein
MDGFEQSTNVKVIMSTNRADTLDPALLRPGRLDRKIEFPLPDRKQKRLIFQTVTSKMNLSEDVDLEQCNLFIIQMLEDQTILVVLISQPFANKPVCKPLEKIVMLLCKQILTKPIKMLLKRPKKILTSTNDLIITKINPIIFKILKSKSFNRIFLFFKNF